jgi:ribosomal protein L30E
MGAWDRPGAHLPAKDNQTMYQLTPKQAKWLKRAMPHKSTAKYDPDRYNRLSSVNIADFNGARYAVVTDGHRLHAVIVPSVWDKGTYSVSDKGELAPKELGEHRIWGKYPDWQMLVPKDFIAEHMVKQPETAFLRSVASQNNAIRLLPSHGVIADWQIVRDAVSYAKFAVLKIQAPTRPFKFEFTDGAFAVVMPYHPDRARETTGAVFQEA